MSTTTNVAASTSKQVLLSQKFVIAHCQPFYYDNVTDFCAALQESAKIMRIDAQFFLVDIAVNTPKLEDLLQFDGILLVAVSSKIKDNHALGDALAAYSDAGKGVVLMPWTNYMQHRFTEFIAGRFMKECYHPLNYTTNYSTYNNSTDNFGTVEDEQHPIMRHVTAVQCGYFAAHTTDQAKPNAHVVARWTDDSPFICECTNPRYPEATLVCVNIAPPMEDDFWKDNDLSHIIFNSLVYSSQKSLVLIKSDRVRAVLYRLRVQRKFVDTTVICKK